MKWPLARKGGAFPHSRRRSRKPRVAHQTSVVEGCGNSEVGLSCGEKPTVRTALTVMATCSAGPHQSSTGEEAAGHGFTLLQPIALELAYNLLQQTGNIKVLRALLDTIPAVRAQRCITRLASQ